MLGKLDTTHRRHPGRILNVYWPRGKIGIDELYKPTRCSDPVKFKMFSDSVDDFFYTSPHGEIIR